MLNREQFISTILKYLKRVPYEERIEVERYYNEIFDEAGIGGNDLVPESFGNPREIALDILTGLEINKDSSSEYSRGETIENENKTKNYNNKLLIIILAIFAAPIGIPVALMLGFTFLTLIISFGAVLFGLAMATVGVISSLIISPMPFLERLVGIGGIFILIGMIILVAEFFKGIIKRLSDFVSRKIRERRFSNEKKY